MVLVVCRAESLSASETTAKAFQAPPSMDLAGRGDPDGYEA